MSNLNPKRLNNDFQNLIRLKSIEFPTSSCRVNKVVLAENKFEALHFRVKSDRSITVHKDFYISA